MNFKFDEAQAEFDVLVASANGNPPWDQSDHKDIAPVRADAAWARTIEGLKQDHATQHQLLLDARKALSRFLCRRQFTGAEEVEIEKLVDKIGTLK
jgi:hypothetical protein